jgi:hypothetical protein
VLFKNYIHVEYKAGVGVASGFGSGFTKMILLPAAQVPTFSANLCREKFSIFLIFRRHRVRMKNCRINEVNVKIMERKV